MVYFQPTLPMPTHLVGFVISDYVSSTASVINNRDQRVFPVNAWTPTERTIYTDLVLYVAYWAVTLNSNLFGNYPLPKIGKISPKISIKKSRLTTIT